MNTYSLKRFKPVLLTIASALAFLLFVPCGLVRAEELYHAEASQCSFAMPEGYSLLSSTENGDMFTTDGAFDLPYFGVFTEERSGISDEMTLEEAYTLIADMTDTYISNGVPEEERNKVIFTFIPDAEDENDH